MPQNAASRAHALMSKARLGEGRVHKVWAAVFGLPENSPIADVVDLLSDLYSQLLHAEQEAKQKFTAETAAVKLKHFPNLKRAVFSYDLNGSFEGSVRTVLTESALDSLENLAHDLENERQIEQTDIERISQMVDDLFAEVADSDLTKRLKQFVLSWLAKVRRALDQFRITGSRGLQDALIVIQGEACVLEPVTAAVKKTAPSVWGRVESLWNYACKAVDFGDRCKKLCESPVTHKVIEFGLGHIPGSETLKIGE